MGKKSDLSPECQKFVKSCLPFLVRKRQRRSQLSHLIGYIKRHLKLWVCLTLECTVLWMVRGLVSQIDPKKELKFWTTFISFIKRTIHSLYSRKIAPTISIIHKEIKDSIKISKSKLTLTLIDLGYTCKKNRW